MFIIGWSQYISPGSIGQQKIQPVVYEAGLIRRLFGEAVGKVRKPQDSEQKKVKTYFHASLPENRAIT